MHSILFSWLTVKLCGWRFWFPRPPSQGHFPNTPQFPAPVTINHSGLQFLDRAWRSESFPQPVVLYPFILGLAFLPTLCTELLSLRLTIHLRHQRTPSPTRLPFNGSLPTSMPIVRRQHPFMNRRILFSGGRHDPKWAADDSHCRMRPRKGTHKAPH